MYDTAIRATIEFVVVVVFITLTYVLQQVLQKQVFSYLLDLCTVVNGDLHEGEKCFTVCNCLPQSDFEQAAKHSKSRTPFTFLD